jgi:acetate kinase
VSALTEWLVDQVAGRAMGAIGYRIVQGGQYHATRDIDASMFAALQDGAANDPEHMPQALHLVAALRRSFPAARHIACFDTAFHAAMPTVARRLPIPRRYDALGLRRHGFHGLACMSVMNELARLGEPGARGRVVIAHLGSGGSITAVADGNSIDSTMGLTPAGGIMMSSRSGDVDPGLAFQLFQAECLSPEQIQHMLNHESGLLGVSGITGDLQQLLAIEADDPNAADAVAMFCYQASKAICAMAGALGGIDTLVFSGGVGEHLAPLRARICVSLGFIGVTLDDAANVRHAALVSAPDGAVEVRVIHVDEQAVIAAEVRALIGSSVAIDAARAQ